MAENKTKKTESSVESFIDSLSDEQQRDDSSVLVKIMRTISKREPKMWGTTMIGFGDYHYKYESGREGDIFQIGFSPRKSSLVLYSLNLENQESSLKKLGKFKTGKGCLYIKKLEDIDLTILKSMIEKSFKEKK
ncbi:MAG TPA: DUF1801 domain-containing protein [Cytophagales bacterium]|jgi:hypothetical protein|nr:DUF1801 domain-containing protein [Cytophagales bacterium]